MSGFQRKVDLELPRPSAKVSDTESDLSGKTGCGQLVEDAQRCADRLQNLVRLQIRCGRKINECGLTAELKTELDSLIAKYGEAREEYDAAAKRMAAAGCDHIIYVEPIDI